MKRITKFYQFLLAVGLVLSGCESMLSELPDNRTVIDSKAKIDGLLAAAYPEGNYHMMASIMSDNADDKETAQRDQIQVALYQWKTTTLNGRDTPTFYWNYCYRAIAQANQALASIENLGGGAKFNAQKGEALLCRAYAHFMLVNFWGKHYDPATAGSDLGVPYVLKPETELIVKYKRKSVKEVYDLIEKDLTTGLPLIRDDYKQSRFHFTKAAANAFAARFYLYKGNWDKVIVHASKSFGGDPKTQIRDMNVYRLSLTSHSEKARRYGSDNEPSNLLLVSTSSLWARNESGTRFGLSVDKVAELRLIKNPFGKQWAYQLYGLDTRYNFPKYEEYFKFTNKSAGTGLPFLTIVLFDKDEALLNRAEAYVMKKQYDKALEDLTVYLSKKTRDFVSGAKLTQSMIISNFTVKADELSPHYALDDTQKSFVKAILGFKRWEYYHEGMRWFDVRRFKIAVTHRFKDSADLVLKKDDPRKQLQIPVGATARGLKPNPR